MRERQLEQTLKHLTEVFGIDYFIPKNQSNNTTLTLEEFLLNIERKAEDVGLLLIETQVEEPHFAQILQNNDFPVVYFTQESNGNLAPVVDGKDIKKNKAYTITFSDDGITQTRQPKPLVEDGKITILTAYPIENISKEAQAEEAIELTPLQRLFKMLKTERKDIIAIYVYALMIGAIGLVLPLGMQAIVGLVQGGLVFSSIYLLIGLFLLALLVAGIMQVFQMTIVEYLIERLFAKAAYEYTFRLPKIKAEALLKYYPPELMNRFFDIMVVQKTLPKILIDVTAAAAQIVFGLILLTAYHPFFIAFTLLTVLAIYLIIRIYAPKTLDANILKSKYKYKIAQWLQDIARSLYAFKVAGSTQLPVQKMDGLLNGYLKYQKKYFSNLKTIFYNTVFFKTFITGGLLILGTMLVIDRQITIGQFVASEIVVVLVVSSVEKILFNLDSVFDLLVAVDKLGQVSDLPLDPDKGLIKTLSFPENGLGVRIKNLTYQFEDESKPTLNIDSIEVKPNERICIIGGNGSGKDTLLNILAGILTDYKGLIAYNGISLRDMSLETLHKLVERNAIFSEGIFDGTIYENIVMNRRRVDTKKVYDVLEKLNLSDAIGKLKNGLNTQMISGGRKFSSSFTTKVCLARCIVSNPKLLMISNCYESFDSTEKLSFINFLCDKANNWSLITVSNNPQVLQAVDTVWVMEHGKIVMQGKYNDLLKQADFQRFIV